MLLYALTILVSAFLLFQVEPVIARIILPWFGGSAAVWTTCLLFFQVALLLGYLYAHVLVRYLKARAQVLVHCGLLLASLAALPILPGAGWKPAGSEEPTFRILLLLSATVGLPFFLLSTTGPLVQAWFARRFEGVTPYRLYALSNAGSMFALLSYPVLVEPSLTTHQQAYGWSWAYAGFVVLCGLTALVSRQGKDTAAVMAAKGEPRPTAATYALWIGLPACASILLLSITNHLTQNVAAIPFLWVLPLSLYLLSFIVTFERAAWYRRNPFLQLFAVALGGMAYALGGDFENTGIKALIPLFSAGLFLCCMVCHGELARMKPHPRWLTHYFVMISVGGALGGIFVGMIAPRVFRGYFELEAGLAATGVVVWIVLWREARDSWRRVAMAAAGVAVCGLVGYLGMEIRERTVGYRVMSRNFYGSLRISDSNDAGEESAVRKLLHGTIDHGEQYLSASLRRKPTTYYSAGSGVGLAIREAQPRGPMRVGVIGLGTGTLAAYGRPGDVYRFYEINPMVRDLAQREFTYLGDSMAKVEVVLGDARLSLEREPYQYYDVLAVDAFSGDSIPVHLLTREAFQLYFRQLKPGGVVAVHISNKYLDLQPVVLLAAGSLGMHTALIDTEDDEEDAAVFGSTWILVSARQDLFETPDIKANSSVVEGKRGVRLWTDDYSNLFQILK